MSVRATAYEKVGGEIVGEADFVLTSPNRQGFSPYVMIQLLSVEIGGFFAPT